MCYRVGIAGATASRAAAYSAKWWSNATTVAVCTALPRPRLHLHGFIFSDLKEDLEAGYVRDIAVPLAGFEVVALNVTKLRSDNVDPRRYLDRLETLL